MLTTVAHGSDDSVGALVRQMVVDDQKGMKHAGYPEQQRQKKVQNRLNRFAAQQNSQWGKDNGKEVPHLAPSARSLKVMPETTGYNHL